MKLVKDNLQDLILDLEKYFKPESPTASKTIDLHVCISPDKNRVKLQSNGCCLKKRPRAPASSLNLECKELPGLNLKLILPPSQF